MPTASKIMENYDISTMGKWHHDILIANGIRTSHLSEPYNGLGFTNKEKLATYIHSIYGEELKNKRVLDIACNAGGHLFELNRLKILGGLGFDIRECWIKQAHYIQRNIDIDCSNLDFCHGGFELLNNVDDGHYHVALFNGIFYHLAGPIVELSQVAHKTSELIVINTAYEPDSGCKRPALIYKSESAKIEDGLSGTEGLSWHPNGEAVLFKILKHLGFHNAKLMFKNPSNRRLCVVASRIEGLVLP